MDYNEEYIEKNPTWHVEDSAWKAKQILKILNQNNIKPKSICEIGCGAGEILNQLYQNMPMDVVFEGYEVSSRAYELCKRKTKERLNFHLRDFPWESDAIFDVILCIDILEHFKDYFTFLRELKRCKVVYKIFHIPLDISVLSVFRVSTILRQRELVGHLHYFNKEIALEILSDLNYEIIDYFYTAGSVELPRRRSRSKVARFLRKMLFKFNEDMTVRLLGGHSLLVLAK